MGFSCDKIGSRFNLINSGSQESIRMGIAIVVVLSELDNVYLLREQRMVLFSSL